MGKNTFLYQQALVMGTQSILIFTLAKKKYKQTKYSYDILSWTKFNLTLWEAVIISIWTFFFLFQTPMFPGFGKVKFGASGIYRDNKKRLSKWTMPSTKNSKGSHKKDGLERGPCFLWNGWTRGRYPFAPPSILHSLGRWSKGYWTTMDAECKKDFPCPTPILVYNLQWSWPFRPAAAVLLLQPTTNQHAGHIHQIPTSFTGLHFLQSVYNMIEQLHLKPRNA